MRNISRTRFNFLLIAALAAVSAVAVACAQDSSEQATFSADSGFGMTAEQADALRGAQGPAGEPGPAGITTGNGSIAAPQPTTVASGGFGIALPTPTPAAAFPTPAPSSLPFLGEDGDSVRDTGNQSPAESPLDQQVAQVATNRIIVRNVDMSIEVVNPTAAIEEIGTLATQEGGWVVQTRNSEVHRGAIDIRVPADRLDAVLASLRDIADDVVSEVSSSQDFTEEFTDTTARIQTLQDTVDALRALFARAEEIEDALQIQREVTRIQADIEAMQARVNFISQSAAFSLVRVTVLALPQEIEIDAGPDRLAAVGRSVRFRAEFTPPEGIENFQIEWDFGDGSRPRVVTAVAPVNTEGRVISAPLVHTYGDDTDSPYIVQVKVTGTGESGAAEGEDVMVVTVNRVPAIEVFAGDNRIVDEGDEITLRGSFTRPDGVESLTATWDFGDGSAPVTVDVVADATQAEIKHAYANSRPQNYNVVLTVKGETPSGSTEGTDTLQVLVEEPESLNASGFAPGDSGRSAVRTLSSIGAGIGTALIWIGVLSPVWLVIAVIAYVLYRRRNRDFRRSATESRSETPAN